jgi:tetratricopeptide (TPR) repeat protein
VVVVNAFMRLKTIALAGAAALCAAQAMALTGESIEERCARGAGYDAIAACSDIIGIGAGGAEIAWAYFDRARAYFDLKMYASAIDDLTEDLKRTPDDAEALENRGLAFSVLGDYVKVLQDFDRAIALQPSARMYRERCMLRAASGHELDDALEDCNKALSLKPDDANALDARCFVQFRDAAYAAAISDCSAALRANPRLASSLYVRGLAKLKAGDGSGSNADVTAAKALDPAVSDTYTNYGVGP